MKTKLTALQQYNASKPECVNTPFAVLLNDNRLRRMVEGQNSRPKQVWDKANKSWKHIN